MDGRYTYQWYRSCSTTTRRRPRGRSGSGEGGSRSSNGTEEREDPNVYEHHHDHDSNVVSNDNHHEVGLDGWIRLDGATYGVFQPSTRDVGHRIACVVTVTNHIGVDSSGGVANGSSSPMEPPEVIRCELPRPVQSDVTLFKAALRTFVCVGNGGAVVGERASFSNWSVVRRVAASSDQSAGGGITTMTEEGVELRLTVNIIEDRERRYQGGFSLTIERFVNDVPVSFGLLVYIIFFDLFTFL